MLSLAQDLRVQGLNPRDAVLCPVPALDLRTSLSAVNPVVCSRVADGREGTR